MINSKSNSLCVRRAAGSIRSIKWVILPAVMSALLGCGTGKSAAKKEEFFTSGSREADQRATQTMAKNEQLAGSGEGAGEKGRKKVRVAEASANVPGGGATTGIQVEGKLTLFDRLGGEEGISKIVDDFVPRAINDPRVNWQRKGIKGGGIFNRKQSTPGNDTPPNVDSLKKHIVQFFALATGGPTLYEGKEIKSAHAGMKITNAEFDAVIGDLKASLDRLQIPNKEQKECLAIAESTRPQIVTER